MSHNNPPNGNEVLNRFFKESIFKGPKGNYYVFPDHHPTTWVILRSVGSGELQTFLFYPDHSTPVLPGELYDDFEEIEGYDASTLLKKFPGDWNDMSAWFAQHGISYKCLDED